MTGHTGPLLISAAGFGPPYQGRGCKWATGGTVLDPDGGSASGGSGFEVDPAGLRGAAGKLGTAYDDFQAVVGDFTTAGSFDGGLFGDVQGAWSSFDRAWSYEVTTANAAIAELIQKVSATSDIYTGTDYQTEKAFRSVFGG